MRGLLVLCLIAITSADKLGYNYQPLGHDATIERERAVGGVNSGLANGPTNGLGNDNDGGYTSAGSSELSAPINYESEEYNKQFYTYSAPEEDFHNDVGATQRLASSLRKNLRVLFIRTPENDGLTAAALQLAKQASQDRTAIYVLQKQADISELAKKLQTLKSSNGHKPEVHFVKYRTKEDAVHAQQAIQAEYDLLGGQSHSSDEGVAPVLNFVSQSSNFHGDLRAATETNISGGDGGNENIPVPKGEAYIPPKATYLPSSLRVK